MPNVHVHRFLLHLHDLEEAPVIHLHGPEVWPYG